MYNATYREILEKFPCSFTRCRGSLPVVFKTNICQNCRQSFMQLMASSLFWTSRSVKLSELMMRTDHWAFRTWTIVSSCGWFRRRYPKPACFSLFGAFELFLYFSGAQSTKSGWHHFRFRKTEWGCSNFWYFSSDFEVIKFKRKSSQGWKLGRTIELYCFSR